MPTTLLPNPLTSALFLTGFDNGSYPTLPSPMTAGCSVVHAGSALTFTIPKNTNAAFAATFATASIQPAPSVQITAFSGDTWDGNSANDFALTFRVTAVTIDGSAGKKAAGGIGLLRGGFSGVPQNEFIPIIEFGGDDNTAKKAFYSWGSGAIGSTATLALPTLPFFVRLIRADARIFAEIAPVLVGPWTNLSTSAAAGGLDRVDLLSEARFDFNKLVFYARNETSGSGLVFTIDNVNLNCWPRFANGAKVINLTAKTWPQTERIDLAWSNPTFAEDIAQYMQIYRSRYAHPEFHKPIILGTPPIGLGVASFGELIYSGVPITSYSDVAVVKDRFYYYSIFLSRVPLAADFSSDVGTLNQFANRPADTDWGPQAPFVNRVTGYVAHDYLTADGEYLYEKFPLTYREADLQDADDLGMSTGYLQRFSRFLQTGIDNLRGQINSWSLTRDAELAPLGMVGSASNQTSLVDAELRDRRIDPTIPGFDGLAKRRLWLSGVNALKLKGSVSGVPNWAKLITGWTTLVMTEPGLNASLAFLRTWDEVYVKDEFTIALSSLTYGAGTLTIAGGTLTPGKYAGGKFVDYFGNVKTILNNTATVITFVDNTFTGYGEIVINGTVAGGNTFAITSGWPFAGLPNDKAYDGAKAIIQASFGTVRTITATAFAGPSFTFTAGGATNGAATLALSYSYAAGGSFGARVATTRFWLYTGSPSWLYNPKSDLSLIGGAHDPFFTTWPGTNYYGSGTAIAAGDRDVVITAPVGAARYPALKVENTTSVLDEIWLDSTLLDSANPIRPGDYVNPNRNQGTWFRIIQIVLGGGLAKLRIEELPGENVSDLATLNDIAVIATRITVERDRLLRILMPDILPQSSKLLVYYS